jgi:hypothetical protein
VLKDAGKELPTCNFIWSKSPLLRRDVCLIAASHFGIPVDKVKRLPRRHSGGDMNDTGARDGCLGSRRVPPR